MEGVKDEEDATLTTAAFACQALGLMAQALWKEQGPAAAESFYARMTPALSTALSEFRLSLCCTHFCSIDTCTAGGRLDKIQMADVMNFVHKLLVRQLILLGACANRA